MRTVGWTGSGVHRFLPADKSTVSETNVAMKGTFSDEKRKEIEV